MFCDKSFSNYINNNIHGPSSISSGFEDAPYMSFTDCLQGGLDYNSVVTSFGLSPSSSEVFSSVEGNYNNNNNHQKPSSESPGGGETPVTLNSSISNSSSSEAGVEEEDSGKSKKDNSDEVKASEEEGSSNNNKKGQVLSFPLISLYSYFSSKY